MTRMWACQPFITEQEFLDSEYACPIETGDPIDEWIDIASDILYHLSDGWITGVCTRTVRPVIAVGDTCLPPTLAGRVGFLAGGAWYAESHEPWLHLRGPNATVLEVKIDGAVLDPSEYVLLDGLRLMRTVGSWPTRNDIRLPDTAKGTWSITVQFGNTIDRVTRAAALEMTAEMAQADAVGGSEVFPPGVVSANVQGATAAIDDITQAIQDGRELLPKTARFISLFGGRGAEAHLWSPEIDTYRLVEVRTFA